MSKNTIRKPAPPSNAPSVTPRYSSIMEASMQGGTSEEVEIVAMTCRAASPCGSIQARVFTKDASGHMITYECASCKHRWNVNIGGTFNY
jgi:hypothetical protein